MAMWNSIIYICTKSPHYFLYFACRPSFTVIQPPPSFICCLHRHPLSHHPFILTWVNPSPAINTLLAIRYSSILPKYPNHLNTFRSALLANSLSIPALLSTTSFHHSILSWHSHQTSLTHHPRTFTFLLAALPVYSIPLLFTTQLQQFFTITMVQ